MSEIKTRSFRAEQSTLDRFTEISKDFENQGAALESLIQAYELQNAKAVLTTRQTDVEDFDSHLQAIQSAFLHSLEIAENADERVRLEFQKSLESKDKLIASFQERCEQSERQCFDLEAKIEELSARNRSLDSELASSLHTRKSAETALNDKQVIIDTLTKQLSEAIALSEGANEVKASEESLKEKLLSAENKVKELEQAAQIAAERAENAKEKAVLEAERAALKDRNTLLDTIMKQNDTINELKLQLSAYQSSPAPAEAPVNPPAPKGSGKNKTGKSKKSSSSEPADFDPYL